MTPTPFPLLPEIDFEVLGEQFEVPESFKASVFLAGELMEQLGLADESEFWLMIRAGRIPRPIFLPVFNRPVPVWDKAVVLKWAEAGYPADQFHVAHERIVLTRLVESVRAGMSQNPPTIVERN